MTMRFFTAGLALAALAAASAVHGQSELPDGPGKAIVQQSCVQCHALSNITRAGYSRTGWQNIVASMRNNGAQVSDDQVGTLVDYLAANFPERARPTANVIVGRTQVAIQEWQVPTPGSRPHDPLAAPDGAIWYSGQMANVLGRLDPATGTFKEYKLPPNSGPHGLVFDASGNVW